MSEISKIVVIGAGFMGHGIAQVCAMFGYQVTIRDINDEMVNKAMKSMTDNLQRHFVGRGKLTEEQGKETLERLKGITNLAEAVKDADLIIEAVPEKIDLKKKVFKEIEEAAPKHAIIASNTSSLSISEMASATKRPDKFIGTHFFSPPQAMRLVEIVKGLATSKETVDATKKFIEKINRVAIVVNDYPGFVTSRLGTPMWNEATYCLMQGLSNVKDIDTGAKLGNNWPMGPFEIMDFVGVDVALFVMEILHREMGEKYRPCPLLKKMVRAGYLGQKTGKGFYDWSKKPAEPIDLTGLY
jgi:3-hydroxybutyryl-CoA dehydrogenase